MITKKQLPVSFFHVLYIYIALFHLFFYWFNCLFSGLSYGYGLGFLFSLTVQL